MYNHKFTGMQDTGKKTVAGEKIYQEHGTTKHYKEDYLGQKVECDANGNVINYHDTETSTTSSGNPAASAGFGMIILGLMIAGAIVAAFDGIIIIARNSRFLIKWSLLSTGLIPMIEYLTQNSVKAGILDGIIIIISFINRIIVTMAGYSVLYYFLMKTIANHGIHKAFEIILLICSFILFRYLQRILWAFLRRRLY